MNEINLLNTENNTYILGEEIKLDKELNPLSCELARVIYNEMKYSKFISTLELEKLSTCHNLDELKKIFEIETKILEIIFQNNPNFLSKNEFEFDIDLNMANYEILNLLEKYITVDYVRSRVDDNNTDYILLGLKLHIKKTNKNKYYISDIGVITDKD